QSMLNSKLFYLYLYSLNFKEPNNKFEIVMFNKPNIELDDDILKKYLWEKTFSVDSIPKSLKKELKKIAGDQNIVDYIFIDKQDKSIERTIDLNNTIFKTLSLDSGQPITGSDEDIFVSMTTFKREDYGAEFMDTLAKRLYLDEEVDTIPCIRSVIMDPWAVYTDAEEASVFNNFFTDVFIPQLRNVVNELCEEHAIKRQEAAEMQMN
ncbi:MAG: hypothetical protein MI922_17520, partial [Bacteroidales bacterium]|nr:hypothetical protein [Bacteroidales bacterium]